jgi:hypothetical protein
MVPQQASGRRCSSDCLEGARYVHSYSYSYSYSYSHSYCLSLIIERNLWGPFPPYSLECGE